MPGVRFGIFYEHQLPRPWEDGAEHRLLRDALDQVEIADRVGFDYVWEVEHHFLEEYSHSSAPEVFLAAASQRTKRIRLGHGIVQIPPQVNHPARVAERIATLDLISDGRLEFGTGESSSQAELGGFLVERDQKRAMWDEALDAITRMFVEEPFAGWDSEYLRMPPRNVIPKPLQKPHPPLWVACSRRETIQLAARKGIGALSFSFVEPEDAGKWVDEYYSLIESDECVPAGFAVNPNVTVVLPMMCHEDEEQAIERGVDGGNFFGYSLVHYYGISPHQPGVTNIWDEFHERRDETGFSRAGVVPDRMPLGVRILQEGVGSLRGAVGTPDQIAELCRRYEAQGVDQIVFVLQAGNNRHEDICHSLELFGERVIPEFAARTDEREREKMERLAPAIERALARREPARQAPPGYQVDEQAELARERRRSAGLDLARLPSLAAGELRGAMQRGGQAALAKLVAGRSDAEIEKRFGRAVTQKAIFAAMARAYVPEVAAGFEGEIVYELTRSSNGRRTPDVWTLRVQDGRATAVQAGGAAPAVLVRLPLPDFARIVSGELHPAAALMDGSMELEGDLRVAARLGEMFGGPSPY
jgi:alkanesulfonate monooxygenase SsuD/methylene tetrahydromethanopterin reductase-like flavin-dependent oxidoreductase (luciferase family)